MIRGLCNDLLNTHYILHTDKRWLLLPLLLLHFSLSHPHHHLSPCLLTSPSPPYGRSPAMEVVSSARWVVNYINE